MRFRQGSAHSYRAPWIARWLVAAFVLTAAKADVGAVEQTFGASLTLESPTRLAAVVAEPDRYADEKILLSGRLTDLCTKKGCWTVLADGDATVRVRFEDYGFFLPPDALGRHALVEGRAQVRVVSEREARHLASESRGGDPASIVGPQRELGFVASGVRLIAAP